MPYKGLGEGIDFIPFDFTGITPVPGAFIKWKSRQKWRRPFVRGEGRLISVDSDGWFRVRYSIQTSTGYKSKTVRIEPLYVVDYREEEK